MKLPSWVKQAIETFRPPDTGRVEFAIELFKGGVTKVEISEIVRIKPPQEKSND